MARALDLCDRAVMLEHGSIIWQGTTEDAADHVADIFDGSGAA